MFEDIAAQLRVAGMSDEAAAAKHELFDRCRRAMSADPARWMFVPGRIEVIGKHTDYAGGRSLVCAAERGICTLAAPRADARMRVTDARDNSLAEFDIDRELSPTPGHWSNYPVTVARRVARDFSGSLRGADIAFASDLPPAAGMSSSSALVIATFLALDAVNDLRSRPEYVTNIRSDEEVAGYLATVENGQSFGTLAGDRGVGTFGGSEDHIAILCGRAGYIGQYSFCPAQREREIAMPADHVFAIAVSGVVAEKTGAARESYNRVSALAQEVLTRWNRDTGREDATLAAAVRSDPTAPQRMRQILRAAPDALALLDRLEQFIGESEQIVPAAGDALENGDLSTFGALAAQSLSLAERLLRNQVPESIDLAKLAQDFGASASSAFGAGFGGSVWALVRRGDGDTFLRRWRESYLQRYPMHSDRCDFFITGAGPAALVGRA
jgi:galactokinase